MALNYSEKQFFSAVTSVTSTLELF